MIGFNLIAGILFVFAYLATGPRFRETILQTWLARKLPGVLEEKNRQMLLLCGIILAGLELFLLYQGK